MLVGVERHERRSKAPLGPLLAELGASHLVAGARLDLDDFGAEQGQMIAADRPRPVQRLLRRLRLPADRCVRRGGPFCNRATAAQQAAERGRDRRLCAPSDRRPAPPLAKGRDPAARRQPLCLPGSVRLVPEEPGGLDLRPGRQCRTPSSCRRVREEHRRAVQDGPRNFEPPCKGYYRKG